MTSPRLDRLYSPPEIGAPGKRQARSQRRDLILAGLFFLAMVAVVIATLTLLLPGLLGKVYRVQVYFLDAEGLDPGIQVVQDGYVIGMVERVVPVFPGRDAAAEHCPLPSFETPPRAAPLPCFKITLRIKDAWPVPCDSRIQLASAGLLKGDVIEIHPGQSAALLADGAIMAGIPPEPTLAERIDALAEEARTLVGTVQILVVQTIAPALDKVDKGIASVATFLGAGDEQLGNRARLADTIQNLYELSERLKQSASALDAKSISGILTEIERLARDYGKLANEIQALIEHSEPGLQRSLDDTQYLLQEVTAALTPILSNIEDATRNLSVLTGELRNDPAGLIKGHEAGGKTPWFK